MEFCGDAWEVCPSQSPYRRTEMHFGHVMTAGSITSMLRARLWDNIQSAVKLGFSVSYCDTDSLLVDDGYQPDSLACGLGGWEKKLTIKETYIVAQKVYALRTINNEWHHRSAGSNLSAHQIKAIALGKKVNWRSPVPTFSPGRSGVTFKEISYGPEKPEPLSRKSAASQESKAAADIRPCASLPNSQASGLLLRVPENRKLPVVPE